MVGKKKKKTTEGDPPIDIDPAKPRVGGDSFPRCFKGGGVYGLSEKFGVNLGLI